ncbi:MAG TPA: roadblock/LC7 domain-containing protein [Longimicrobium sp.]|nr:roadblock/LC7 domain-containing protein [Longimicrobium sp.]
MSATPQQVRQWSDEVAADPGSPAFRPLAEHYRAAGRADAALRLVIRGLERHPNDVEAHHLLGVLYREGGEPVKAFDEWDIALALDAEHFPSRRAIGMLLAERGEWDAAERHLERALEGDSFDPDVRALLEEIHARRREGRGRRGSPAPAAVVEAPAAPSVPASSAPGATGTATSASASPAAEAPSATSEVGREFDVLERELGTLGGERGIIGAVVLDAQGFVVAGRMHVGGRDRGPEIAAVLSPASTEAERAVRHLKMGGWKSILVETADAVVRLAPTPDSGMVAVAGRRDVPMGWVLRVAARVRDAAVRFVRASGGAP